MLVASRAGLSGVGRPMVAEVPPRVGVLPDHQCDALGRPLSSRIADKQALHQQGEEERERAWCEFSISCHETQSLNKKCNLLDDD